MLNKLVVGRINTNTYEKENIDLYYICSLIMFFPLLVISMQEMKLDSLYRKCRYGYLTFQVSALTCHLS